MSSGPLDWEPNAYYEPIHSLFGKDVYEPRSPDVVKRLKEAEVILGRDVNTRNTFILFGRDTLEEIVRSDEPREVAMMRIELDQDTVELETICALMEVIKGRCDYQPGGTENDSNTD
jgi:hypothetical protein